MVEKQALLRLSTPRWSFLVAEQWRFRLAAFHSSLGFVGDSSYIVLTTFDYTSPKGATPAPACRRHRRNLVAQNRAVAVSSQRRPVRVRTAMEAHSSLRSEEQIGSRALKSCMRFVDVLRHEVSRTIGGKTC